MGEKLGRWSKLAGIASGASLITHRNYRLQPPSDAKTLKLLANQKGKNSNVGLCLRFTRNVTLFAVACKT